MNKRQKKKRIKQWCKEHARVVTVLGHHVVGYCAVIKEQEHDDSISRQAAINAIKAYLTFADWKPSVEEILEMAVNDITDMLERLPSAQPEKDFRGYINMLDISRDDYRGIMEYINEVPSAQSERG